MESAGADHSNWPLFVKEGPFFHSAYNKVQRSPEKKNNDLRTACASIGMGGRGRKSSSAKEREKRQMAACVSLHREAGRKSPGIKKRTSLSWWGAGGGRWRGEKEIAFFCNG